MRANDYYQTDTAHACPLVLLSHDQLETLSMYEQNSLKAQQFSGKAGDMGLIYSSEGCVTHGYIGRGVKGEESLALASVAKRLPPGAYKVSETLPEPALVAWALAQYQFNVYKSSETLPRILVVNKSSLDAILPEVAAVFLVRDLINTPANALDPKALADVLLGLADTFDAHFEQWVGEALLEANYPAIHAVGRAAASEPRLLSLTWGEPAHPRVTLVGKGVCFDSGGLDIKAASDMRLMKKDMGGAAQVIGLAQWIMQSRLPIRLQVLIPAVENAVSGNAYRPGDVLTMRNGMSVEIHNTDAEGRLVLADALVKASEEKPDVILDFATLTGAARVAVGTDISALFTNDDALADALLQAANDAHDPIWRMPLFSGYQDLLASNIADMSNVGASPYAGSITAALFLQRFVSEQLSWAHFDIMAWNLNHKPGKPEGGEAMGIRAVARYLKQRYKGE